MGKFLDLETRRKLRHAAAQCGKACLTETGLNYWEAMPPLGSVPIPVRGWITPPAWSVEDRLDPSPDGDGTDTTFLTARAFPV